jgi:hypothetical protein
VFSTCTQENKSPHPNAIKGCQSLDGEMKDETSMENCCKVVEVSDLKPLDQKQKQKRSKAI